MINYNTIIKCRCDGIGRRAGLKIRSWRQGAGSTPATGTKQEKPITSRFSLGYRFFYVIIFNIFIWKYTKNVSN